MSARFSKAFLDSLRIHVKGGKGGSGLPKYGGVGGKGGDVYIVAKQKATLHKTRKLLKHSLKAGNGGDSYQFRIIGEAGKDCFIPSPCGVTVMNDYGEKIGELNEENDEVLVGRGGAGGFDVNQFNGQKGENRHIRLLLRLIADVGLVGFPNAGKSTFLRAISKSKPKVASYPFTTLHPTVGTVKYSDLRSITIADLPGLIEGASMNAGMGHSFLRHIERTKILLFIVDINGFRLSYKYPMRSPIEVIFMLNREIELYLPNLTEKPCMLIVNKMDSKGADKKYEKLVEQLPNIKEIFADLPEQSKVQNFVKFTDILKCSAKFDRVSIETAKEKIRRNLDINNEIDKDSIDQSNITLQMLQNSQKNMIKKLL